ncbi:MAG: hypothetical protein R3223_09430 [Longimicrobiales bacterium]|nr:hypothetical protein [Longimicrobiales bacterium]
MILRRYGSTVQSVDLNFDARAISEVGFRRDHSFSLAAEEFEEGYEKVEERELTATAESSVQDEGETALLDELEERVRSLEEELGDDQVLVVENTAEDYPKTRDKKKEVVVEGKNRLRFSWRIEPPLRLGIYRRKSA